MRISSVLALLLLVSCTTHSPLDPGALDELGPDAIAVPVSLESAAVGSDQQQRTVSATGGVGQVSFAGVLSTAQGGYTLRANGWRDVSVLRLEVVAEQTGGGLTIPVHYRYDAVLREIPPGRYTVQVVHRREGRTDMPLQQEVIVR